MECTGSIKYNSILWLAYSLRESVDIVSETIHLWGPQCKSGLASVQSELKNNHFSIICEGPASFRFTKDEIGRAPLPPLLLITKTFPLPFV